MLANTNLFDLKEDLLYSHSFPVPVPSPHWLEGGSDWTNLIGSPKYFFVMLMMRQRRQIEIAQQRQQQRPAEGGEEEGVGTKKMTKSVCVRTSFC